MQRLGTAPVMIACLVGMLLLGWGVAHPALAQQAAGLPADQLGPLTIVGWGGVSNKNAQELFSDPFSKAKGIQVQWIAGPGQQVAGIQAQAAAERIQWDVANALLGDQLVFLQQKDLLWKFPADVKARLEKQMPGGVTDYGMAYASLSDVIACNTKMVTACPKNPREFFDVKKVPGARALYVGSPLVAMALALEADGVPSDRVFPMDIDRAYKTLQALKPSIKVLWQSGDQSEQIFRNGEVAMAVLWNGRAHDLAMHPTDRMAVEVSWEGAVYEPAYTAVVKGTPHPNAAFQYLEWVADHPDGMARYAERTTYGFPSLQLFKLVSEDIARWLPEYPAHFKGQVHLDLNWYLQHKGEIDSRWKEFTSAR